MTKPLTKIEKHGKQWELIYGPLENTWEGQRIASNFEKDGIQCIEVEDPNGQKYLYRDSKGWLHTTHTTRKLKDMHKSRASMEVYKPQKSALRKLAEEVGDVKRTVQVALFRMEMMR